MWGSGRKTPKEASFPCNIAEQLPRLIIHQVLMRPSIWVSSVCFSSRFHYVYHDMHSTGCCVCFECMQQNTSLIQEMCIGWQRSIFLNYLWRTKDNFLVYGADNELIVTGYIDASFQINVTMMTSDLNLVSSFVSVEELWAGRLLSRVLL